MSEDGGDTVGTTGLSGLTGTREEDEEKAVGEVKVVLQVLLERSGSRGKAQTTAVSTYFSFSSGNTEREETHVDPVLRSLDEVLIESHGG